jgi:hypothetical protein
MLEVTGIDIVLSPVRGKVRMTVVQWLAREYRQDTS